MKTILCNLVSIDPTFQPFLAQVPDDHEVVAFCKRWEFTGKSPWIDMDNDSQKLINLWHELMRNKLPIVLPATIDHVLYAWID